MEIKRIVSYYARPASARTGGVNTSRQQWMLHLAEAGFTVEIIDARGGFTEQLISHPRLRFTELPHVGAGRMTMIPLRLSSAIQSGDLVYLHEGWTPSNVVVAAYCRMRRIPYVVLPHGVYEPQIVDTLKKFPFRRMVEGWVLNHALAVHMFFPEEAEDLHSLAPRSRVVSAMTGMPIPPTPWTPDATDSYIAWLGRYDILHKGIDKLFEALSTIPTADRPRIEMRGPDYFGGKDEAQALLAKFGLTGTVNIGGELSKGEVEAFLRGATAFIHVPRWEAFGRTILESLALGVPLILGDGARVAPRLRDAGAARVISSTDPDEIAVALSAIPGPDYGARGREWALDNASWEGAVRSLIGQLQIRPAPTGRTRPL